MVFRPSVAGQTDGIPFRPTAGKWLIVHVRHSLTYGNYDGLRDERARCSGLAGLV